MSELRVQAASWTLQFRWTDRHRVDPGHCEPSSLKVVAAEPVTIEASGVLRDSPNRVHEVGLSRPLLWETRRLEVLWELEQAGSSLRVHHPDPKVRKSLRDGSGRGRVLAGSLDLESRVGFLDLEFHRDGVKEISIRLEVFPSKLEFRRDFEQMLAELGSRRIPQVLQLLPPTSVARELEPRRNMELAERYQIFDAFFDPVLRSLRQIARQPNTGLERVAVPRSVERVRRPDAATRRAVLRGSARRVRRGSRSLPALLPDGHRDVTYDTPANRFAARAVRSMLGLLDLVRWQSGGPWNDRQLRQQVEGRRQALRHWLATDFLREVPDRVEAPGLVVQRSPGYRDLLKWYRRSLLAFSVLAGDVRMGLKDLWYVYQLWCAVKLEVEVARLLGPGVGTLVPFAGQRLSLGGSVSFPDGTVLTAQHRADAEVVGVSHQPDLLLELRRPAPRLSGDASFQLVIDAKYRLTWDGAGRPRPPQGAINAIHRYRDSLLSRDGEGERMRREVYGGAILFPHPDEDAFEDDRNSAWHQFERLGIGAVPLVPGQGRLLRRWLSGLLHASDVRLDRLGPVYRPLPPRRRPGTVLVAPLAYGAAQLQQMLDDGWYHLPARNRLDHHRPTHLAPYEGAPVSAIRHLWEVGGWELVDGERIAGEARFRRGRRGRSDRYWRVQLVNHVELSSAIQGYDWAPRGPMYTPLEVFDLADSVFFLHGDLRDLELLRVLFHIREGSRSWEPGWRVVEPLVMDGQVVGKLEGDASGCRWEVRGRGGEIVLEELRRAAIGEVFHELREAMRVTVSKIIGV